MHIWAGEKNHIFAEKPDVIREARANIILAKREGLPLIQKFVGRVKGGKRKIVNGKKFRMSTRSRGLTQRLGHKNGQQILSTQYFKVWLTYSVSLNSWDYEKENQFFNIFIRLFICAPDEFFLNIIHILLFLLFVKEKDQFVSNTIHHRTQNKALFVPHRMHF